MKYYIGLVSLDEVSRELVRRWNDGQAAVLGYSSLTELFAERLDGLIIDLDHAWYGEDGDQLVTYLSIRNQALPKIPILVVGHQLVTYLSIRNQALPKIPILVVGRNLSDAQTAHFSALGVTVRSMLDDKDVKNLVNRAIGRAGQQVTRRNTA